MNMKYSHYSCHLFPDMFSFVNMIPTIWLLGSLPDPHIPFLQWPSKTLFQLFHSHDYNSPEKQLYMVNSAIVLCTVPLFLPSCSLVPTVPSLPHQDLSVNWRLHFNHTHNIFPVFMSFLTLFGFPCSYITFPFINTA